MSDELVLVVCTVMVWGIIFLGSAQTYRERQASLRARQQDAASSLPFTTEYQALYELGLELVGGRGADFDEEEHAE